MLIATLGAAAVATIVWAVRHDALLAPLGIIALTVLLYFVVRPLELLLSSETLLRSSYDPFATGAEALNQLSAQEISLYVHSRMIGTLDGALGRAMLVLALFFLAVLAGHRLRAARRLAATWSRLAAGTRALDLRWVIAVWLAVGLLGQALILASIGGVAGALAQFSTTANLGFGFILLVALNFYTAGLLLWACWHPPACTRARVALGAAVAELAAFYLLLGSRTLVLVPVLVVVIALHELVRPWRPRALLLAIGGAILFSSAYLSLREGSRERPVGEALADVPAQAVKARALLGTSPVFDQLLIATNRIPAASPYRHGGELGQAIAAQVPSVLYPQRPEPNDTSFRKLIWGERFLAGRPIGAAGGFYRDFGFAGVLLGGLLLGLFARALTGLRAGAGG
ncbi:MAG: hypothetical protein ACRDMZ_00245, partial [Solirubrobacteraceae bacterium]